MKIEPENYLKLIIDSELDQDNELQIEIGNDATTFLTIDQVRQLRDHLNKVLEAVE